MSDLLWDVFIICAREDNEIAKALAVRLIAANLTVWLDDQTMLQSGDSLQRIIDEGLNQARCGIAIISGAFLSKCPASKCDSLFSYQQYGRGTFLPLWHGVSATDLGGWSPISKVGLFTSRGMDEVSQQLLANIQDLPGSPKSSLRFLDSIYADPVAAKISVSRRLGEGATVQVLWPTSFDKLLQRVEALKLDAERYLDRSSCFHGVPSKQVVSFLGTATRAISHSQALRLNAPNRILSLIEGMSEYWLGAEELIERSLVNFLTLANFEAQTQLAYCFRFTAISNQMPPEWLHWFEPERSSERKYAEIFGIEEEIFSARVQSVSDVYVNAYIWGPRWMVMQAANTPHDRPIANSWFVYYLIPQLELQRLWDPELPAIKYLNRAVIVKVLNEAGEEMF